VKESNLQDEFEATRQLEYLMVLSEGWKDYDSLMESACVQVQFAIKRCCLTWRSRTSNYWRKPLSSFAVGKSDAEFMTT
jgi:hypothetical protein